MLGMETTYALRVELIFYDGGVSGSSNYSMSFVGNNDYINGNLYNNFNNGLSVGLLV